MGCLTSKEGDVPPHDRTLVKAPDKGRVHDRKGSRRREISALGDPGAEGDGMPGKKKKKKAAGKSGGKKKKKKKKAMAAESLQGSCADPARISTTWQHAATVDAPPPRLFASYASTTDSCPIHRSQVATLEDDLERFIGRWVALLAHDDPSALSDDVAKAPPVFMACGLPPTHLMGVVRHLKDWVGARCRAGGVWGARDKAEWTRFIDTVCLAMPLDPPTAPPTPNGFGADLPNGTKPAAADTPPVKPIESASPAAGADPRKVDVVSSSQKVLQWMAAQEALHDPEPSSGPFALFGRVFGEGKAEFSSKVLASLGPGHGLSLGSVDAVLVCFAEVVRAGAPTAAELSVRADAILRSHTHAGKVDHAACRLVADALWDVFAKTSLAAADKEIVEHTQALWEMVHRALSGVLEQLQQNPLVVGPRTRHSMRGKKREKEKEKDNDKNETEKEDAAVRVPDVLLTDNDGDGEGKIPLTWSFRNQEQLDQGLVSESSNSNILSPIHLNTEGDRNDLARSVLSSGPKRIVSPDPMKGPQQRGQKRGSGSRHSSSTGDLNGMINGHAATGGSLVASNSKSSLSNSNLPKVTGDNPVYLHNDVDVTDGSLAQWSGSTSLASSAAGAANPPSRSVGKAPLHVPSPGSGSKSMSPAPPAAPTPPPAPKLKGIPMSAVSRRNTKADCWVVIRNRVYNITAFLSQHPGGQSVLLKFAGKDATNEFQKVHGSEPKIMRRLEEYFIDVLIT